MFQNSKVVGNEQTHNVTWIGSKLKKFCAGTRAKDGNLVLCDVMW